MLLESGTPEEPAFETVVKVHTCKKRQGKRNEDLSGFPVEIVEHRLSPDQLDAEFPGGYYEMKPEIYKELEVIPAQYIVYEHHVYSYMSREKTDGDSKIIRAPRPEKLLNNSIRTPSLAAYVINQKYVDAMRLNRIHDEFRRNDLEISRQVLAGWMIKLADRYLSLIYNAMKKVLLGSKLIHCDETPFTLIHDGKGSKSKNYMWVYHSDTDYGTPPIYIYEYQPTRKTEHPRTFLQDFHGTLVTDGYQVYHTLQDERPDDIIDSKNGATSSAMLYSIAETAKANKLKPYEYFKHTLNEILIHQDEPVESYINDLLPWSDKLSELCKSIK